MKIDIDCPHCQDKHIETITAGLCQNSGTIHCSACDELIKYVYYAYGVKNHVGTLLEISKG